MIFLLAVSLELIPSQTVECVGLGCKGTYSLAAALAIVLVGAYVFVDAKCHLESVS